MVVAVVAVRAVKTMIILGGPVLYIIAEPLYNWPTPRYECTLGVGDKPRNGLQRTQKEVRSHARTTRDTDGEPALEEHKEMLGGTRRRVGRNEARR